MFYRYEIRNYYGKDVLYLYATMSEEFADELDKKDDKRVIKKVENYIKNKNINYDGDDFFLVIDGIVVKSFNIKNKDINIEILDDKCDYVNIKYKVRVKDGNKINIISLKDFLIGVLFSNITYNLNVEVIKSLCVLYRTYTFYRMDKDGYVSLDDKFMKYRSNSYYKLFFVNNYDEILRKLETAVNETDCIFITYNDKYIKPYIHHTNNGFTDTLDGVEYLEKRNSLWDLLSPIYLDIKEYTYDRLEKLLNVTKDELQNIKILELSSGNKIRKIKIGPITYSGEEFRKKINLKSCDITILINDYSIKFITRGSGNGLGISISGSSELARSGCSYLQILNYYFPKCSVKKYV